MDWLRLVATPYDLAGVDDATCRISPRSDVHGERWTVRANDGSFEMILATDRTIETIFLFAGGDARLPLGLQRHFCQGDVHAMLGDAARTSPAKDSPLFGPMAAWDRYDMDLCSVHIEYETDKPGLKLVTLMMRQATP